MFFHARYSCGCRNGLICDHIKAALVFVSRVALDEHNCAGNHDLVFSYWKSLTPLADELSDQTAVRIENCLTQNVYLSDLLGRSVTEEELAEIL